MEAFFTMQCKTILIAEDEAIPAMVLKMELYGAGYDVVGVVSGGAGAIEKALELKPDLLLMDIFLDDMINGIEAVKEIRKTLNIPVIYVSASADPETLKHAKETGFASFITKPYLFNEIYNAINAMQI